MGHVYEVFISKRLNRWKNRNIYDFMRFSDVKNVRKLEKELDNILIGTMNIYVNMPKYRRVEEVRKQMPPTTNLKPVTRPEQSVKVRK